MKKLQYILCCWILTMVLADVSAQLHSPVSIRATAVVIEHKEIELITFRDLVLDESMAVDGVIYISAHRDSQAGSMLIKGKPDAQFRLTYLPEMILENTTGTGIVKFFYEVYGFQEDNQPASEPIDALERTFRFSNLGQFFIWVGGHIDISNAMPGAYIGEFTIEIEYI